MIGSPPARPNTALHRTPSASPPSRLSRKPLAATEGACVASRESVSRSSLVVGEGQDMNGVAGFEYQPGGVIELLAGLVLRPKRLFHRFARFASVRRRTSSHAVPPDSPRRTLRARRSISAAHAASRSAFSSGAASRLSSSSTATLARSSGPSFRASSSTSLTSAMQATLSPWPVAANPRLQRAPSGFAAVAAEPQSVRRSQDGCICGCHAEGRTAR